MQSNVEKKLTH